MRALKQLSTILALGLAMPLTYIGPAGAAAFEVRVDTSGVPGDAVMAFDFSDSDAGSYHQLHIWDFASDGKLDVLATNDPANCPPGVFPFSVDPCRDPANSSVTGSLGNNPPVMISDAPPPGITPITYFQRIDLSGASSISFRFEMSGEPTTSGETPDGFAFSLLDLDSGFPLVSPETGFLVLYTFGGTCDAIEGVRCTEVRVPSVPEPTPVALTIAALVALMCARRPALAHRRRSAVRA